MEIYRTTGTCSKEIIFEVDENEVLTSVRFVHGCNGNSQGIARLAIGMKIDDIIAKLKGVICRAGTSCPDQFAKALLAYKAKKSGKLGDSSSDKY